jgi:hypothetical protein
MSNSPLIKYVAYKTANFIQGHDGDPEVHAPAVPDTPAKYSVFKYTDETAPGSGKKLEGAIGEPIMFAIPNDLELDLTKSVNDISKAKLVGGRAKSRRGRRGGRRNSKKTYKK